MERNGTGNGTEQQNGNPEHICREASYSSCRAAGNIWQKPLTFAHFYKIAIAFMVGFV